MIRLTVSLAAAAVFAGCSLQAIVWLRLGLIAAFGTRTAYIVLSLIFAGMGLLFLGFGSTNAIWWALASFSGAGLFLLAVDEVERRQAKRIISPIDERKGDDRRDVRVPDAAEAQRRVHEANDVTLEFVNGQWVVFDAADRTGRPTEDAPPSIGLDNADSQVSTETVVGSNVDSGSNVPMESSALARNALVLVSRPRVSASVGVVFIGSTAIIALIFGLVVGFHLIKP